MKITSVLNIYEVQEFISWMCENFCFTEQPVQEEDYRSITNGNCRIRVYQADKLCEPFYGDGGAYTGWEHIALETADINLAFEHCKAKGFRLELCEGRPFYNPGVWGTGMWFFNVFTDFGIKLELAQRLDTPPLEYTQLCFGLEHYGCPVYDMQEMKKFYMDLDFTDLMSERLGEEGSYVYCSMMGLGDNIVELYETTGIPHTKYEGKAFDSILIEGLDEKAGLVQSPNGEKIQLI